MPSQNKPKGRFESLKDILKQTAEEGKKYQEEDIESGDYQMYPYERSQARGLMGVLEAAGAISDPSEEEIAHYKEMTKQAYANKGIPYDDSIPPFIPTIPGTISGKIKESRLAPLFNLKEGMKEDEVLKNILASDVKGTSRAYGAGLLDKYGQNSDRIIKGEIAKHIQEGNTPVLNKWSFPDSRDYPLHEARLKQTPGTSYGVYNRSLKDMAVDRGGDIPEGVAGTLGHEVQHAADAGNLTEAQWNKIPNYGDNLKKQNLSLEDYNMLHEKLTLLGKFDEAIALENAMKKGHFPKYKNLEAELALQNILKNYSENPRPEDLDFILKNFPKLKSSIPKK